MNVCGCMHGLALDARLCRALSAHHVSRAQHGRRPDGQIACLGCRVLYALAYRAEVAGISGAALQP